MKEEKTTAYKPLFRTHKTVSVEEIMAAGGPTIYAIKSGKTTANLVEAMKYAPPAEPFTEGELEDLLQQLKDTK